MPEVRKTVTVENVSAETQNSEQHQNNGEVKMNASKNLFGLTIEFGPLNDENIASTLIGVAVRHNDGWRVYDKEKNEIIDLGEINLGNFPLFLVPSRKLCKGDLIKEAGEYYFVENVGEEGIHAICIENREKKLLVPCTNIAGFKIYSKVIALRDIFEEVDDRYDAIQAMMLAQSFDGVQNADMSSMLPFLFLSKDNELDDDRLMTMMLLNQNSGDAQKGSMNSMLPFLLMSKDTEIDPLMMLMMLGQNGDMNSILPFLLMGKDTEIDPLMLTMLGQNSGNAQNGGMNSILPFLFLSRRKNKKAGNSMMDKIMGASVLDNNTDVTNGNNNA